jgi:hypothetical protein
MPINFLCGPWAFWECAQNMAKGLRAESNDGIRTSECKQERNYVHWYRGGS